MANKEGAIDEFVGPFERSPYCLSRWLFLTCSTPATSSHCLDSYRVSIHAVFGQRPRMSPDSSTLMSLFEGPKQVYVPYDFWVALETVFKSPSSAPIRFMIDAAYLYHRDSNSPLVSPYSYVPFQIWQTTSHEDITFHENAMGPMQQFFRSLLYSASH